MLIPLKSGRFKGFRTRVRGQEKRFLEQRVGENVQDYDGFKNFSTGRVTVYLRGQYLATCHEVLQKSQSDKGCIVALKFSYLSNLAGYDMSRNSEEIISLQKLYCFFKFVFFSVKNFAEKFRYGSSKDSTLELSFLFLGFFF